MDEKPAEPAKQQPGHTSVFCPPPLQPVCTSPTSCICQPAQVTLGPPPRACTVFLVYPDTNPANVQIAPMEAHCDAAGVELALAVALAKLLGAP